ncbi:SET and MYND domain-containing protein 4-like [Aphidius gifuensis]|uniref:SET and MYND domain-containing protein 4-like n=1 Tax=Aphidius gifuensis TaxID=684658 RepID=UPI001CDC820D|nr:SET and MYND domain-containing protein 4-like [Aphidius gifuensis]
MARRDEQLCKREEEDDIIPKPKIDCKSADAASMLRMQAQLNVDNLRHDDTILDYTFMVCTKSIAYAPPESKLLALAFNLRSEITFKAKLISDCLEDIKNALLTHSCPDEVRSELYLRQATCYQITKKNQSLIDEAFLNARKFVKNMKAQSRDLMERKIVLQENKTPNDPMYYKVTYNEHPSMVQLKNENPDIPGASDAITIKYDENYGRHIVATRDIKPGETLLVQKPYAAVLYPSMRYNHCWYCRKQTWSSIPCEKCTKVMFCSSGCRAKAMLEFHDYECPIIETILSYSDDTSFLLDLQLLIKGFKESNNSLDELKIIFDEVEKEPESLKRGCTDDKFIFSTFRGILSLAVNMSFNEVRASYLLANNILTAYHIATKTNIIGENISGKLSILKDNENFVFLMNVLSKLTYIADTNSHQSSSVNADGKNVPIFVSIEPVFHFFNHSCVPTMTKIWHENLENSFLEYDETDFIDTSNALRLEKKIESFIKVVEYFCENFQKNSVQVYDVTTCLHKLLKLKQNKKTLLLHAWRN